jgi:PKD repeat protein
MPKYPLDHGRVGIFVIFLFGIILLGPYAGPISPVGTASAETCNPTGDWDACIDSVSISGDDVSAGDEVEITTSIKNTGERLGTFRVAVGIKGPDGSREYLPEEKIYDIPVGGTDSEKFSWDVPDGADPGEYEVTVDLYNPPGDHMFDTTGFRYDFRVTSSPTASRVSPDQRLTVEPGEPVEFRVEGEHAGGNIGGTAWYINRDHEETTRDMSESGGIGSLIHTFRDSGTYTVEAEVFTWEEKYSEPIEWTVNVESPESPPTAEIDCSPTEVTAGESVRCSARYSEDEDGYINTYEWDFDDGYASSETGQSASYSYDDEGYYAVELTVTDNDGLTDTVDRQIEVESEPEVPPTAEIDCSPTEVTAGESVSCSARYSDDEDGYINTYEWDFDDGYGSSETGQSASYTYDDEGSYIIELTVTDNNGLTDTTEQRIEVESEPEVPPTAEIDCSPTEVTAGESVSCSASYSEDEDGYINTYEWDFDDRYSSSETGQSASYTYDDEGYYTVELTVTDNDGLADTVDRQIEVESEPEVPPTAEIDCSPTEVTVGEVVRCSADDSEDEDGYIDTYEWEFDNGYGGSETGRSAQHTFEEPGTYTVQVTVTGNDGLSETSTAEIDVTKPEGPTAEVECMKTTVVAGESVRCTADDSTHESGGIVSHDWSFDGESTAGGESATHTFRSAGSKTVEVTVADRNGITAAATTEIMVNPEFGVQRGGERDTASIRTEEEATFGITIVSDGPVDAEAILLSDGNRLDSREVEDESVQFTRRFSNPGTRNIEIQVLGAAGQSETVSWDLVVESENPEIKSVTPPTQTLQYKPGKSEVFSVTPKDPSEGSLQYQWQIDDSPTGTDSELERTFSEVGEHTVKVTVSREGSETVRHSWNVMVYPFENQIEIEDQSSLINWDGNTSTETFTFTVRNPKANEQTAVTEISASLPDGVELRGSRGESYGTGSTRVSVGSVEPGAAQSMRLRMKVTSEALDTNEPELVIPYQVVYYPEDQNENDVIEEANITVKNSNYTSDESPVRGQLFALVVLLVLGRVFGRVSDRE